MVVVLITGMSGTGKSTVLAGLAARGFDTADTDQPGWIEFVDGEPLWREDQIVALLEERRDRVLFIGGTVRNQGRFTGSFDAVVLLTAPLDLLLERIRTRGTNDFGKADDERRAIIRDHRETEPLLRAGATHVVDAAAPLDEVVDRLIEIAGV